MRILNLFTVAIAVLFTSATMAQAGPFRRQQQQSQQTPCFGNSCQAPTAVRPIPAALEQPPVIVAQSSSPQACTSSAVTVGGNRHFGWRLRERRGRN